MTHYVYPMEVQDEGVYRFLEWLDEEYAYVREKYGTEAAHNWDADISAGDLEEWTRQCVQYLDRAVAFGIDTPKGKQAVCKFVATAIGLAGSVHRIHGALPRGGTTSGGGRRAMILLAVDPGKTVGAAVWSEGKLIEHGQCEQYAFQKWAEAIIPVYAPWDLEVVWERYKLGPRSLKAGSDFEWATDVIGTLRYWCRKYEVPYAVQDPAKAKSFSTNEKLRAHGWYVPTPGGHANDAARHLLVRLVELGRVRP